MYFLFFLNLFTSKYSIGQYIKQIKIEREGPCFPESHISVEEYFLITSIIKCKVMYGEQAPSVSVVFCNVSCEPYLK
jgi:hypothetical protein